jgi:hypothetical protein
MYTKTSVTILIGSPPLEQGENYFVKVLNSGTTTDTLIPKDFHDWDEQGFKANIVQHFVRFLSHTSGAFFCLSTLISADLSLNYPSHTNLAELNTSNDTDPVSDKEQSLEPEVLERHSTPGLRTTADGGRVEPPSHFASMPSTPQRRSSSPPLTPQRRSSSTPSASHHSSPSTPEPLRIFPSPLRRQIDSQPHAAAEERRLKLMQMTPYEFTRACNVARNQEMMKQTFGLTKPSSGLKNDRTGKPTGSQVSCDNVRRSSRFTNGESGTQANATVDSRPSAAGITAASSPDPVQCPGEPLVESHLQAGQISSSSDQRRYADEQHEPQGVHLDDSTRPMSRSTINRTSWPQWLSEKYDHYAGLEFGDGWNDCLYVWTELERAFEFQSPVSSFL